MGKIKKIAFFLHRRWILWCCCVIIIVLFTRFGPNLARWGARQRVPAPERRPCEETRTRQRETEEKLARLVPERDQLKSELTVLGKDNELARKELEEKLARLVRERDELKSELAVLREDNELARKELIETLEKYSMLAEKLKRVDLSVAAVMETLEPVYADARAEDTAESLRTVLQSSAALASAAAALCEEVTDSLRLSGLAPDRAAKLRVLVDQVKSAIRRTVRDNRPSVPPQGFSSCRILNLDPRLKAAVFSAGYRNGLRPGMVLRTPDGKTAFRVVMVNNFTAAGLLEKGNFNSVGIGTNLSLSRAQTAITGN